MHPRPVSERFRAWFERPSHRLSTVGVGLLAAVVAAVAVLALSRQPGPHDPTRADASIPLPTASLAPCRPAAPSLITVATRLRHNPSTVRVVLLGDGTRDDRAAGRFMVLALRADLAPARVVSLGRDGYTLERYERSPVQRKLERLHPAVFELSIGIDDLRRGATTAVEFRQRLGDYVARLHHAYPKAGMVLSVPAALATHDVGGAHLVTDGTAQRVTSDLRIAYRTVARTHRYVVLNDVQRKITGTKADPSLPPLYLSDQVDPSARTAQITARLVADAVTC